MKLPDIMAESIKFAKVMTDRLVHAKIRPNFELSVKMAQLENAIYPGNEARL